MQGHEWASFVQKLQENWRNSGDERLERSLSSCLTWICEHLSLEEFLSILPSDAPLQKYFALVERGFSLAKAKSFARTLMNETAFKLS